MIAAAFTAAVVLAVIAGFNDGGNLFALSAASRTIPPVRSFLLIVAGAFVGPFVLGTAVAHTTGTGVADYATVGAAQLFAAIAGAIATVGLTFAARVPTSISAALFASMVGALWSGPGLAAVRWHGVELVAVSLVGSVVIGAAGGAIAYGAVAWLLARVHRPAGERIVSLQHLTTFALAVAYGSNDLERTAGLLGAAVSTGTFTAPAWTFVVAGLAFVMGLVAGGGRIARTVGGKLFSIRPQSALAAEVSSAATVICSSLLGGPLSTTAVAASSLIGVGAAVDSRAIHWHAAAQIALTWIVTVPAALVAGALAGLIVRSI
ncbi:MAG TPA: inorganic phosphate transporter [Candidatus Eremiobacteraceae bacterium]|nr:inorganic phosphate transporter [Candidatus Eremiobacteraceae bacterium]